MRRQAKLSNTSAGFTLTEVLVALGIMAVLFGLISINLGKSQSSVSVTTVADTLMSDIKHQQLLAMMGGQGSASSQQAHGLYVQPSAYTLFAGSSYNAGDSNNFTVDAPANITFSTSFASTTALFAKGSGEVQSFVNGNNTITITGVNEARTITIGRLGALSVN